MSQKTFDPALLEPAMELDESDAIGDLDREQRRAERLFWRDRELTEQITDLHRLLARLTAYDQATSKEADVLRSMLEKLSRERAELRSELGAAQDAIGALQAQIGVGPSKAQGERSLERERKLLPVRHKNRDFFLADLFDYALKDDGASMEAPIFTLATKPDLSTWKWASKDGNKSIEVYPSVKGRATQFDKDVLIYVVSQLTEALNRDREDAKHRTVRFTVHDYLVATNKGVSGDDYKRLQETFERLAGTRINTDIRTGGERVKEGFGIIDSWRIIDRSRKDERMVAVEITLSQWLYNAVQAYEVLTIHPDYFRLRKPLERRLYEIARKHCGHQTTWSIGLPLLREKTGSRSILREFRRMVKQIAEDATLPEYRMTVGDDDRVTFRGRLTEAFPGISPTR